MILAKRSWEYQYGKAPVGYPSEFGTQIIKGKNGNNYEVTVLPARKMYEKHVPANEQVVIVQHLNQPPPILQLLKNANTVQPFNNQQQQHFNLNSHPWQNRNNQYSANTGYLQQEPQQSHFQQQVTRGQQQPLGPTALITPQTQGQQLVDAFASTHQQQQQQQPFAQYFLQQPPLNNNNHVVNNPKYISQSEAAQLDVYPFKQINGNPRSFTRLIINCDGSGKCETQSTNESQPNPKNCENKTHNHFMGYDLPNNRAFPPALIVQTGLRNRRLVPYSEVVISQYPYN